MRNTYFLFPLLLFFTILTILNLNIPFFWDGTFFSELSVYFFENGYTNFIPPQEIDNGGIHLYSIYLTLIWNFFGKKLAVSHLALLPFILGIAFEYFKLAKRFLKDSAISLSLILLIAEPSFITQTILMGYDIFLIYFFFLSLNALLSNKNSFYKFSILLLCCCNIRGIILFTALFFIELVINYSSKKKINYWNYVFAFVMIGAWGIFHFQKTGWFFFSPVRENTHESFLPINKMFNQFIFICWKIVDFGRITLWLFLLVVGIVFYRKLKNQELLILLKILFIPLIILSLFMIPIANPIGHKYFIVIYLCLNIVVCYLVQLFLKTKFQILVSILFIVSLISGNFYLYPEKYGNGWDSSLKIMPYFELKNKMDAYILGAHINPNEVGTQYPLIADKRFSHLVDEPYKYQNVWSGPLTNFKYILQTNVINTDIIEQFESVKKDWKLLKMYKSGQVYISLYQNTVN